MERNHPTFIGMAPTSGPWSMMTMIFRWSIKQFIPTIPSIPVINNNCPHPNHWMYLKVDANLAISCQNEDKVSTPDTLQAGKAMLKCGRQLSASAMVLFFGRIS